MDEICLIIVKFFAPYFDKLNLSLSHSEICFFLTFTSFDGLLNNFFINNFMNIIRFFSTFMTFFKFLCISFHLVVPLTKSKKKMLLQFFCFYN